jgi:hypothetical protein
MDGARPHALSDAQLDRELEAALGVEPSPEFLARVRTHIASESRTPGESGFTRMLRSQVFVESGFSRILKQAVEPMWAVGIVGIVLAVLVPHMMRDEARRPRSAAVSVAESPRTTEAGLPATPELVPQTAIPSRRPAPRAEAVWGRTVPLQLSPVLFAEDDPKLFLMFVAAVADGRVPEEAVQRSEDSGEIEGLSIEPLAIAPLPSLARTVREGENQWE